MTFLEFKKMVAAYMTRDLETFTLNGVDVIGRAIHQARRWAERSHNFEFSRMSARLEKVHFQNGALLSSAVNNDGGTEQVAVKVIERAFLQFNDGSGQFPIHVVSRARHMMGVLSHYESLTSVDPRQNAAGIFRQGEFQLVRWGPRVYIHPADSTALGAEVLPVYMDVVRWMPDYKRDEDTDYFLEYCEDFIKFRTIYELNFMLKEDLRVPLSKTALEDSWESVRKWDSSIITGSVDDANLD